MSLDIRTAIQTALVIITIAIVISFFGGISSIRKARTLPFFRMRREHMVRGWRRIFRTLLSTR